MGAISATRTTMTCTMHRRRPLPCAFPESGTRLSAYALTSDVDVLRDGETQVTSLRDAAGDILASGFLCRLSGEYTLQLGENGTAATSWLRALSDGLTIMDANDIYANAPGPVVIEEMPAPSTTLSASGDALAIKAYGIGAPYAAGLPALPRFDWQAPEESELQITPLHAQHQQLDARMAPFAGYEMPLWYSSVAEEHRAVRERCGIFDVAHMGVYRATGAGAERTLDALTTNDVRHCASALPITPSCSMSTVNLLTTC